MENWGLILNNLIIFTAMITISFIWKTKPKEEKLLNLLIMGGLLAGMTVISMSNGVDVGNGYVIDARYVIVPISFLFYGTLPGIMVTATVVIFRIIIGGNGISIGITFAIFQALFTYLFKRYYLDKKDYSYSKVAGILYFASLFMQCCLILIALITQPVDLILPAIKANWIFLVFLYPPVVWLYAYILGRRYKLQKQEDELFELSLYFESVLENSPNPIMVYDSNGFLLKVNKAWYEHSGYSKGDFSSAKEWVELAYLDEFKEDMIHASLDIPKRVELEPKVITRLLTKSGEIRIWDITRKFVGLLPSGRQSFITTAKDITEITEYENKLKYNAYHDHLTNLVNRRYYDEVYLYDHINDVGSIVVYGDLNNLKYINDNFGHAEGDKAIKACADVLLSTFKENAVTFRFGGDEFLVIIKDSQINTVIDKFKQVNKSLKTFNDKIQLSVSLGISEVTKETDLQSAINEAESKMYSNKYIDSASTRSKTIDMIIKVLFEKDNETERHSRRVNQICKIVSKELDLNTLQVQELIQAGLLHDIGKILIPSNILLNKGRLSKEEYAEIKRHSELGYNILSTEEKLEGIAKIVLHHHEKYDGGGYPAGISGEEIPYLSRILTVCDAFEAMNSDRPYRDKLPLEKIRSEFEGQRGKQFDPELTDLMIRLIDEGKLNIE